MDNLEFKPCNKCKDSFSESSFGRLCHGCLHNLSLIQYYRRYVADLKHDIQKAADKKERFSFDILHNGNTNVSQICEIVHDEIKNNIRLTKIGAANEKITEKTYHLAMDFDCKETAEAVAGAIDKYLKKQKGGTMSAKKKNFKPGDLVTSIRFAKNRKGVVCRQKNTGSHVDGFGNVFVCFGDDGEWVQEHYLFHGHNVTIDIKGEELPERLQTEWVEVPSSNPIHCVIGSGNSVDVCLVSVEMPKHIARQYREWRDSYV